MSIEDRIRTRAYEIYLADTDRASPKMLDDWLAAEREILAQEIASASGAPPTSYDQDQTWYDGEAIAGMFRTLAKRLQNRRTNSVMLRRITEYQDYLTTSHAISDAEAVRVGTSALHIYRLGIALRTLLGAALEGQVAHSVSKELKDLFSNDEVAYETASYNIVSAAQLQRASGVDVVFLEEGADLSPDLRIGALAYVECKDLHPASRDGIAPGLRDHLDKATTQLNAAATRTPLVGTGICVDVPWGTLPLTPDEWSPIRDALERQDGPMFVLVTCSAATVTKDAVSYPTAVSLVTKQSVPHELHEKLLQNLARRSYRLAESGFEEVEHETT